MVDYPHRGISPGCGAVQGVWYSQVWRSGRCGVAQCVGVFQGGRGPGNGLSVAPATAAPQHGRPWLARVDHLAGCAGCARLRLAGARLGQAVAA
eukprot:318413-Chlamydomonas_euryale.AAC.1